MGDVYIVGCLGNAAVKADCFCLCYLPAVRAAEWSKSMLASSLPITRTPVLCTSAEFRPEPDRVFHEADTVDTCRVNETRLCYFFLHFAEDDNADK